MNKIHGVENNAKKIEHGFLPSLPSPADFSLLAEFFRVNFPTAEPVHRLSITSLCFSTPPLLKLWWLPSVLLLEDIWHHLLVPVFLPKLYATGS